MDPFATKNARLKEELKKWGIEPLTDTEYNELVKRLSEKKVRQCILVLLGIMGIRFFIHGVMNS